MLSLLELLRPSNSRGPSYQGTPLLKDAVLHYARTARFKHPDAWDVIEGWVRGRESWEDVTTVWRYEWRCVHGTLPAQIHTVVVS